MRGRFVKGAVAALVLAAALVAGARADEWEEFDDDVVVGDDVDEAAGAGARGAGGAGEEPVVEVDVGGVGGGAPSAAAADAYDEEEELDEDEFVVAPPPAARPAASKPAPGAAKPGAAPAAAPSRAAPKTFRDFYAEMFGLALVVAYLVNFLKGRRENEAAANAWYAASSAFFESQFAVPGAYNGEAEGARLIRDSPSCYKYYASGRRHCDGMMATLDLVKRHDLLSVLLAQVDLERSRDTVTLEVKMDERAMPPVVLAVVQRRRAAKVKAEFLDLEQFAAGAGAPRALGDSLSVLADIPEHASTFLSADVCAALAGAADLLHALHITDRFAGAEKLGAKVVRLVAYLPRDAADMRRLHRLTEVLLHMVDTVAVTKLSAQTQARAAKLRQEVAQQQQRDAHEQRQEAAQRRREEQRRRDEEAWASMTDDQKRKKEEQDHKKMLRRSMKMKKVR